MKPFDLEAALNGEPVKLRNGEKAVVVGEVPSYVSTSFPLRGFTVNALGAPSGNHSWRLNGRNFHADNSDTDIVGMWEEPQKMVSINDHEFPQPQNEPLKNGTDYWYLSFPYCKFTVMQDFWASTIADRDRLANGIIHLTREAAEAHATALNAVHKELLK